MRLALRNVATCSASCIGVTWPSAPMARCLTPASRGATPGAAREAGTPGPGLAVVRAIIRARVPAECVEQRAEERGHEALERRPVLVAHGMGAEPGERVGDRVEHRSVILASQACQQL